MENAPCPMTTWELGMMSTIFFTSVLYTVFSLRWNKNVHSLDCFALTVFLSAQLKLSAGLKIDLKISQFFRIAQSEFSNETETILVQKCRGRSFKIVAKSQNW